MQIARRIGGGGLVRHGCHPVAAATALQAIQRPLNLSTPAIIGSLLRVSSSARPSPVWNSFFRPNLPVAAAVGSVVRCFSSSAAASGSASKATPPPPSMPSSEAEVLARLRESLRYCTQRVREHDRYEFYATFLAPRRARPAIIGTRALHSELTALARSSQAQRESQSQPLTMLGGPGNGSGLAGLRFEWWRTSLDNLSQCSNTAQMMVAARRQPSLEVLGPLLRTRGLGRIRLMRLIAAREAMYDARQPATLEELVEQCEAVHGSLFGLALDAAGVSHPAAEEAARHVGVAVGLFRVLRGLPGQLNHDSVFLPADLCERHGVDLHKLFLGETHAGVEEVAFQLAALGREHLHRARQVLLHGVPLQATGRNTDIRSNGAQASSEEAEAGPETKNQEPIIPPPPMDRATRRRAAACLLVAPLVDAWFVRLQHCGFNLFNPAIAGDSRGQAFMLLLRMARHWVTGTF